MHLHCWVTCTVGLSRLTEISVTRGSELTVRFRFVFSRFWFSSGLCFVLLQTLLKQTFWLENLIKYSPVIIILLLSFKERENMAPCCKFKSPVWEHFDFLVAILLFFYVCCWKNIQIYIMSTCFGCEIQTVYSYLNRTEITENRHQKLKPNRTKSEPWQP